MPFWPSNRRCGRNRRRVRVDSSGTGRWSSERGQPGLSEYMNHDRQTRSVRHRGRKMEMVATRILATYSYVCGLSSRRLFILALISCNSGVSITSSCPRSNCSIKSRKRSNSVGLHARWLGKSNLPVPALPRLPPLKESQVKARH